MVEEKSIGKFIDRQREPLSQGLRVGVFPGRFFARGPEAAQVHTLMSHVVPRLTYLAGA